MDHLHRANTPAFPFSQQTVGAGWHMFLPLAIALHTLDRHKWIQQWEKSPTASEQAHLLRKQLPNTLCKVVLKFGVDISDPIPHLNTKDGAQTNKMSTWKWHPNARCPTHRVKVVRYAAMQLTHLSRDIQKHVVISLKSREHSRTTPIAVAILKLWNFISGLVVLGHGEEVPRSSFDPSFFPNPFLVSPIPACIPYSLCNHEDAVNWRCGNCTRNKRRRRFDGWNRHHTWRPRMLVGASTGCRSCTCSDHSSANATYIGRWVVGTGAGKVSGGGICLDKGFDGGILNQSIANIWPRISGPNVGNGLMNPSGKPGHDEKHRTASHIKSCESETRCNGCFLCLR